MFPLDPQPDAFPLYDRVVFPQVLRSIHWSPANDLCVLLFDDNSLSLCRMGISREWSLPPWKATISTVAWHPNGQQFAVGTDQGTVFLVDSREPTLEPRQCWPLPDTDTTSNAANSLPAVTSLQWIDYAPPVKPNVVPSFDPHFFDIGQFYPSLSKQPPPMPLPEPGRRQVNATLPNEPRLSKDRSSLLLIGDQRANIHFSVNGTYFIGSVTCDAANDASVIQMDVAQDLASIQVVLQHEMSEASNAYEIMVLDSRVVKQKNRQICQIADIYHQVHYLLEYLQQSLKILSTHHLTVFKLARASAQKITMIQQEENNDTLSLPHVELLGLLAAGNITSETHEYFTNCLTMQQAKRWEARSQHSYAAMQRIIIQYIQPTVDLLLLQISKIKGYALWKDRYGDMLNMDAVNAATDHARHMLAQLQSLLTSVGKVSKRFDEFIQWVENVIQRLSDKNQSDQPDSPSPLFRDPRLLSDYLMNDFSFDSLAPYFAPSEADTPSEEGGEIDLAQSVYVAFEAARQTCHSLLHTPLAKAATQIRPLCRFHLPYEFHAQARPVTTYCEETNDTIQQYYCFVKKDESLCILVRCEWPRAKDNAASVGYAMIQMDDAWTVTDMEFLDNAELAMIVQKTAMTDERDAIDGSFLMTIPYYDLDYLPLEDWQDVMPYPSMMDVILRYTALENMTQVVMGANGRQGRLIMSVGGANGMYQVLEIGDMGN
ncbi:anaphase-promoting complex, cyclosome, subunit 4-domain-containing protein [Gongronella butleri]|nr:anaphase-promoting complex, cyclosome, subunit 4-domain-containing protein [Gongronella butleri]